MIYRMLTFLIRESFCKDKKFLYYHNENTRQQRLSVSLQKNYRLTLKEDSL